MPSGRPKKPKPSKVQAIRGMPTCPALLSKEGKTEWKRVCKELDAMGLLAKADRAVLTSYCEAWEEFVMLVDKVRKAGHIFITDKGNEIQNPLVGVKNKAAERMLKVACQLGLTPAARTKIEAAEGGPGGSFAEFAGLKVAK